MRGFGGDKTAKTSKSVDGDIAAPGGITIIKVPNEWDSEGISMAAAPNGRPAGALDRGLSILRHLTSAREASVNELAESLDLTRSTAYRLIDHLHEWEFLEPVPHTGRWRLGAEATRMAATALQQSDITQVAPEFMRLLVQQTRETVGLAVFNSNEMVFIHREKGPHPVAVSSELGSRRPLHCTSVGKAFLAALPVEEARALITQITLRPYTDRTVVNRRALENELATTRQRGWSSDQREFDDVSVCCGAAILDQSRRPVGAISVAGLASRMQSALPRVGPIVASTAEAISRRLGYNPDQF